MGWDGGGDGDWGGMRDGDGDGDGNGFDKHEVVMVMITYDLSISARDEVWRLGESAEAFPGWFAAVVGWGSEYGCGDEVSLVWPSSFSRTPSSSGFTSSSKSMKRLSMASPIALESSISSMS